MYLDEKASIEHNILALSLQKCINRANYLNAQKEFKSQIKALEKRYTKLILKMGE